MESESVSTVNAEIDPIVTRKMAANPGMPRNEAFSAALKERPDLHERIIACGRTPVQNSGPCDQQSPSGAAAEIETLVAKKMGDDPKMARHDAFWAVCKENPELRERMVQETNGGAAEHQTEFTGRAFIPLQRRSARFERQLTAGAETVRL